MALFPVFAGRPRIPVIASPLFIVADPKQVIAQYSAEPAAILASIERFCRRTVDDHQQTARQLKLS